MKSWKIPTTEQVEKAVSQIGRIEHLRYFFSKLENPEWIIPLHLKGFFCRPPETKRDLVKGTIAFPIWPESRYLARMSKFKPDVVLDVMLKIPQTDNIRVHEDLAEAALMIPANLVGKWVNKEIEWVEKQNILYFSLFPEKLALLTVHIAKGGQVETALKLAKTLLDVIPDSKESAKSDLEDSYSLPPQPRTRFDLWEYQEIFKKNINELVKMSGIQAFILLCDLLEKAIHLSRRRDEDEGPEDYSYVWRESIENTREHSHGIQNILVSGVRDAAKLLVEEKIVTVQELIEILNQRKWTVFQRVSLYLLRLFPDNNINIITNRLTDYSFFDNHSIRHEYAFLLNKCFNMLNENQRQIILGWIEKGPDLVEFKQRREGFEGKRPTDEEADKYFKYWQRDHLAWFKDQLPENWKKRYESLVAELGQPEHPDLPFHSSGASWVGPTSPKSAEELKQMSIGEIVTFLKSWKPSEDWRSPSPEGLGRILTSVVKEQSDQFSNEILKFRDIHPTYVRSLFSGLTDALKDKRNIEWSSVLALCLWVVEHPREATGEFIGISKDCDSDWGVTRSSIGRLLSEGLQEKYIPFDQRAIVWEILFCLARDSDPTPEYEAKYGGSNMNPATLSINTTRGEAMHAIIRYALWIRQNIEKLTGSKERIASGFDEMPEVRKVLEEHLDILQEPSLAIRAVYGQWLPWLVLLDTKWVKENLLNIFPQEESKRSFYNAAWETYITFCSPYDNAFDVIKSQYDGAVGLINNFKKDGESRDNSDKNLAEHLMTFYWRGRLELNGSDNILKNFWVNGSNELRGHALEFVGRALYEEKKTVSPETLNRISILWERRLKATNTDENPSAYQVEMSAFGWWFVSKKFDDQWAMKQLLEALKISKKIEPDHLVVERLAELVIQMPAESIEALRLIVEGAEEEWGIYSWRDTAKEILGKALQTESRQSAENLIHYLGSHGYLEFGGLLA